ncbi:MAG: 3-ketoacyl-ACP reductase [Azospirillaceae bacterium]
MNRPVALVTGAGRGIGLAIAEALAGAGFDIAIADIAPEAALGPAVECVAGRGAAALPLSSDLADLADHTRVVEAVYDRFGRFDCLVNNAGIASPVRGDLLDLTPENFDRVLGVNLRGTVFLTQTVVARWLADGRETHGRSVVTVTSASAELASPERADYCVSKAGLSMWVKTLTLRLAESGIGVFEVRPGIIRTDMTAVAAQKYDRLIAEGLVPARRWGEAEDVGAAVAALATGRLGFATGSVIAVDGGLSVPRL